MSSYGESRWNEECFSRCDNCPSCNHGDNNNEDIHCPSSKRFLTVGSVRYGLRLGAVSPPPPGAGPRYRSQCCWPSSVGSGPSYVSRIPLLTASSINSPDIFKCINRLRMDEDATSELSERATERDQVLNSTTFLLKNHLTRRAFVRPQEYYRLFECGEGVGVTEISDNLDRLPRFRFGGNRASSKSREREKRHKDQRIREWPELLKKQPVPPPRVKHVSQRVSQLPVPTIVSTTETVDDESRRTLPLRSASFSQVDYLVDDNKYIRRQPLTPDGINVTSKDSFARAVLTLPRIKHPSPKSDSNRQPCPSSPSASCSDRNVNVSNINNVYDIIYRGCKSEKPQDNITQMTNELCELQKVEEESTVPIRNNGPPEDNQSSLRAQEKKRDKFRRRKGIYISQWPNVYQETEGNIISQFVENDEFPIFCTPDSENRQNTNVEIPKLKISELKTRNSDVWSSPQEENLRSEDQSPTPEWLTNITYRGSQASDDKEFSFLNSGSNQLLRADSLSEGEHDQAERKQDQHSLPQSDISDCEGRVSTGSDFNNSHVPRRYSKRPLRGPYGQMLEAEMKKPEQDRKYQYSNELKFLEDLSTGAGMSTVSLSSNSSVGVTDPKLRHPGRSRGASNHSLDDTQLKNSGGSMSLSPLKQNQSAVKRKVSADSVSVTNDFGEQDQKHLLVNHQRTISSPSKLEGFTEVSPELLEQLLRGSSEQLATDSNQQRTNDTRTHVVVELYDTERTYVESLQTVVTKYLEPLKSSENAGLLDGALVDEIFYQIPSLLNHHQVFLDELNKRLELWDVKQKVGDVFIEMLSKPAVIENYTNYVNNWKRVTEIIKNAQQSKPAFAKFLEAMAREHKGKLALDSLLIKPIQIFPKYELLLQRLIKHTDPSHPDHSLILAAQREVHEQLLKINCNEREALDLEQLREIEALIEGLIELVASDRQYLRHDLVSMAAGGGTRKERALFLFSDLLLVTSIKRRSGTIRRPLTGQGSFVSPLEANKYKLLMKIPLDDLEIVKAKDENLRQMMLEIENLTEDIGILNQMSELTWSLHCSHGPLEELIREMLANTNKQLIEQQNSDSQLSCLDLTLNTSSGLENISIVFSKPEKRASWEESFNEAKHKLAISGDRRPCPELVATVPVRKTRAGLQFTCAAPTLNEFGRDVWVCNSDGYVGQVCILSLHPEPTVTSCNGVCNARILCIVCVPGLSYTSSVSKRNTSYENEEHNTIQFDSSSSSDEYDKSETEEPEEHPKSINAIKSLETASIDSDEADIQQSTMWLGTEDGCIHVYNSSDNIRIKKNKIKLQHSASILCIIYLDNKVFVSLANGDIIIYERDAAGGWNINSPLVVSVGSTTMPISKMLPNGAKLWCGCGNTIKVFNTQTIVTENSFTVNNDSNKHITSMVLSGNGVWLSLQNSAIVICFHAISFEHLCEVNVAPAVTKMLTSCDDIIRQHKAACLRVTSLLACKDLLWVGTSAGVLLTIPIPHITPTTQKLNCTPTVVGIPHGHTGHVRFLTQVELLTTHNEAQLQHHYYKNKLDQKNSTKLLVISGGDGYEDFRNSNQSEVAGREDSTNHLLLWNI